mgnify:CR=1 FL=1
MAHHTPRPLTLSYRFLHLLPVFLLFAAQVNGQTGTITIGNGSVTTPDLPINSCYTYNYSQLIYLADEITATSGVAGDITAIRFHHVAGADDLGTGWNDWTVYMGSTVQAGFSGTSNWVPFTELQQVFSGTVQPVIGNWMELMLDTPFPWDGVQNVVVAIDENSPGFGCTAAWKAYNAGSERALLFRSDPVNPDPASPPVANIGPSDILPQIQFEGAVASCLPPSGLTVEHITPTSLDLTWTDNASDSYSYEVRSSGGPGSGSTGLFAAGNVVSGLAATPVESLLPNTAFFIYVRGTCDGSPSLWSYAVEVRTPCEADGIPYTENFGGSTPPAIPACFSSEAVVGGMWNTTAASLPGMSGNCAHAAYDQVFYPDAWLFTTGLNLQGGTSYRLSYQYGNGNLATQDNLSVYYGTGRTALDTIAMIAEHLSISTVNTLANTVDFTPDDTGVYYIGFHYFAMSGGNPGQMFLDDIHLVLSPTCEQVLELTAFATGLDAGSVSWDAPADPPADGYDVYFSTSTVPPDAGTTPNFTAVPGISQPLTSLAEGIPVHVWVRSRCSDADQSTWAGPADFTPGTYQIGNGPDADGSYPINSCYGYNYSQQIYLASEYNGSPTITHIRFKYQGGSADPSSWSNWTVYLGNTGQAAFNSQTDWVPFPSLEQVYTGTVTPVAGSWMDITLDAPFTWDGTSNIVVAVDENSVGFNCTAQWSAFQTGAARGLLFQNDAINPAPASPPHANQGPDGAIAQIQFVGSAPVVCDEVPMPGATTGPGSICPGILFTLSMGNPTTTNGISRQWQTSTNGSIWADAPGASTGTSYSTSQASDTWYRVQVTCDAAGTGTSTPLLVATDPFNTCYCTSVDFTAQVEPICKVIFAGIDNDSPGAVDGSPAVEDFTDVPAAELVAGSEFPIGVTGNTNGNLTDRITVFFDWDQNGQFDAVVPLSSITNTDCGVPATGIISVPIDALEGTSRMRVVKNAGPSPLDPCATYSYGQAEDYLVNVTLPDLCDALPTPGNTTGPDHACPDVLFTMGLDNPSSSVGISYQWEFSTDGSIWTEAPGNSMESHYSTSQTEPMWYRAQMTCDVAGTTASAPLHVGINAPTDCYCNTLSFSYQVQPICHVSFAGIDNSSSGTFPLEDFTATTPGEVVTGFSYPLSVKGYSDITTSQVVAFFDWNQDGVFDTSVPLGSITSNSCTTELTALVAVPMFALAGNSRMRVLIGDFNIPSDPCDTYVSGQGEDYLIHVATAPVCNALPQPGNTTGPDSICPNTPFTLGMGTVTLETGISYQWQRSTDGAIWTDAPGNSDEATFTTSLSAPTWYRAEVTCAAAGATFSTPRLVDLAPPVDCYCTGVAFNNTVLPICNTSFADLDHASDGTLNSSPGFEDFSTFTAQVFQGHTYTLTVRGNAGGGTGFVSSFFDWDGNGVFETVASVGTITGVACESPASLPITVPPAAAVGTFRMRILMNANNYASDPCAVYNDGQAEEYSLEVGDAIGIAEIAGDLGLMAYPNPASTELFLASATGRPMDVVVYDMLGHAVLRQENTTQLNIVGLAPGSYLLVVDLQNGGDVSRLRFVKQ